MMISYEYMRRRKQTLFMDELTQSAVAQISLSPLPSQSTSQTNSQSGERLKKTLQRPLSRDFLAMLAVIVLFARMIPWQAAISASCIIALILVIAVAP